jgi:hypothetical protein
MKRQNNDDTVSAQNNPSMTKHDQSHIENFTVTAMTWWSEILTSQHN